MAAPRAPKPYISISFTAMQSMGKGREDLLIEAELFAEGLKVLPGVTVLRAAHIDHVSNHLGALNVSQKLEPETTILMGALNDT